MTFVKLPFFVLFGRAKAHQFSLFKLSHKMTKKEYNGWYNWHTWNAYNWLTHDYNICKAYEGCETKRDVKHLYKSCFPNRHDGIKYTEINFTELFDAISE